MATYRNTTNLRVNVGDSITTSIINTALENTDANHDEIQAEKILTNYVSYNNGLIDVTTIQFDPSILSQDTNKKRCKIFLNIVGQRIALLPYASQRIVSNNEIYHYFRLGSDEIAVHGVNNVWSYEYKELKYYQHNITLKYNEYNGDRNGIAYLTITNKSESELTYNDVVDFLNANGSYPASGWIISFGNYVQIYRIKSDSQRPQVLWLSSQLNSTPITLDTFTDVVIPI